MGGVNGGLHKYQNKKEILEAAERSGLKILPTAMVKKGDISHGIEYPVITKAADSLRYGWKDDIHICESEDELKEAYKTIKSDLVVIQKFIDKENEYCLDGFAYDHGNKVFNAIESLYKYNIKGNYGPYMSVANFSNPEVKTGLEKLFAEVGFEGVYSAEFLVSHDGTLYFSEINFRNSTWSYASTCAGMPLPLLWAQAMAGELPEKYQKRIPNGFTAMVEVDDFRYRVRGKRIGLKTWLKDFRDCNCKFYLGRNDARPFIYSILYRGRNFIRKRIGKVH